MKTKIKKLEDSQRLIDLAVPQETLAQEFGAVLKEFQENAQVKGFRRGKAPLEDVKKMYEKQIREEVLKRLIFAGYRHAVEHDDVRAFGSPEVSDVDFKEESLTFRIKTDVWPEVKVDNYREMKIPYSYKGAQEEEIAQALEYIRGSLAEFAPILEDRPAQEGDYVMAGVSWFHEGNPIDKKEEALLSINEKEDPLGLAKNLAGLRAGVSKKIDITMPQDFHAKELAGKTVTFDVSVKQLKKRVLPELDETFAQKVGFPTIAALKEEVTKDIEKRKKMMADIEAKKHIFSWIAAHAQVEIPRFILQDTVHRLSHERQDALKAQNRSEKEIAEALKTEENSLKEKAREELKIYFVLHHVAENERIGATDEEVKKFAQDLAARYSKTPQEIETMLRNEDFLEEVRGQLREHKTIDFLLKNAIIDRV